MAKKKPSKSSTMTIETPVTQPTYTPAAMDIDYPLPLPQTQTSGPPQLPPGAGHLQIQTSLQVTADDLVRMNLAQFERICEKQIEAGRQQLQLLNDQRMTLIRELDQLIAAKRDEQISQTRKKFEEAVAYAGLGKLEISIEGKLTLEEVLRDNLAKFKCVLTSDPEKNRYSAPGDKYLEFRWIEEVVIAGERVGELTKLLREQDEEISKVSRKRDAWVAKYENRRVVERDMRDVMTRYALSQMHGGQELQEKLDGAFRFFDDMEGFLPIKDDVTGLKLGHEHAAVE